MVVLYTYITQCFLVNYSVKWYTIIFVKIYVVALFNLNFYFYFERGFTPEQSFDKK